MSCFHKPDNTDTLRRLIAEGVVVVNVAEGTVSRADGTRYRLESNFGGYLRFRVNVTAKERPWFFVHKAVVLALGHDIPERMQIDHIDRDNQNNAGKNLRIVTYQENLFNRVFTKADYGQPAF